MQTTAAHAETKNANDYQKTIRVKARPAALFEALTTIIGLSGWWAPVTGSGEQSGELAFEMNAKGPLRIHVDEAARSTSVKWCVTECIFEPDWVGTRPTFSVTEVDSQVSELHFRHFGLTSELPCIEMCTRGWNHFLESFRQYVETGVGMPLGSERDRARRKIV